MKPKLFELLDGKNIPYAVIVSKISYKFDKDFHSLDYWVIAPLKAFSELRGTRFTPAKKRIVEADLRKDEVSWFRLNCSRFTKVVDNEHGRVYEIPERSFKTHYNVS
jgi:hypothetical protein